MRPGIEGLFRGFYDFFWELSGWFAHFSKSLCEGETPDIEEHTLALQSGDLVTVLDLSGSLTLLDGTSIRNWSDRLAKTFAASFSRKGHILQFVFLRDHEGGREEVLRATAFLRESAVRMRLDLSDYFSSLEDALDRYVAQETATLAIFTERGPEPAERKEEKKGPLNAPGGSGFQRLDAGIPLLPPATAPSWTASSRRFPVPGWPSGRCRPPRSSPGSGTRTRRNSRTRLDAPPSGRQELPAPGPRSWTKPKGFQSPPVALDREPGLSGRRGTGEMVEPPNGPHQ
jgi:hypothetical protein